ncbi:MAG: MBOAT family protein, partial [Bdellovibrio sp.]
FLALERVWKDLGWSFIPNKVVKGVLTFLLVNIGWVFFRSHDLSMAGLWLKKVFLLNSQWTWDLSLIAIRNKDRFFLALAVALGAAFFAKNTWEIRMKPSVKNTFVLALLFLICLMYMGEESPFLYFQF